MEVTINNSNLRGSVHAPASKSSMQRACAAALLRKGKTVIANPGYSNDDQAAIKIIQDLGARIIRDPLQTPPIELVVESNGLDPVSTEINCGESGLGIRMFTPLVSLSEKQITINGEGSLLNRPMDFFDAFFPKLGVRFHSNKGKLPLVVQGPLKPMNIEVDGSLSSQFLTGLLMAYGNSDIPLDEERIIEVKNLKSKPYIDLTLEVMRQFKMNVPENDNHERFIFYGYPLRNKADKPVIEYTVEGDWSGGAFLLVAGAIAGKITVTGLDPISTQADKAILQALMDAGAGLAIEAKGIKLHKGAMKAFSFDANDCPDLFPPLVALAAYCKGNTIIRGVNRLTHKESNRAESLQREFGKMGIRIEINGDEMTIEGTENVNGATLHSHHDHRIAMAGAVAALGAKGETIIKEAQAVRKSYPDFYEDLKSLGAAVSLPTFKIN